MSLLAGTALLTGITLLIVLELALKEDHRITYLSLGLCWLAIALTVVGFFQNTAPHPSLMGLNIGFASVLFFLMASRGQRRRVAEVSPQTGGKVEA